jgi:hypothetical protein
VTGIWRRTWSRTRSPARTGPGGNCATGGNPEAYARQVIYHLQVSPWRRKGVPESLPGELPERRDGRDQAGDAASRLALRQALLTLPARQRAALVLRYFEDRSEAEAAELLGCRVGTLKSHLSRGLAALRKVHRYVDGSPQNTSFGTANDQDVYASPSPDGTRVVVNTSPNPDSIVPGDLVVVAAGGARRVLAHNVQFAGGSTAVWTPDGTAVIADGKRYDAATAATTSVGALQYLVFSPSGTLRAYNSPNVQDSIEITKADGSSRRTVSVAGLSECTAHAGCPTSVQSVSDDGRYLALGDVNSDPRHVYTTTLVYDTVTKQRVSLGQLSHAWFRADGAVVISENQAKLYDKNWHLLRTYPLPATETGDTRLHYRP